MATDALSTRVAAILDGLQSLTRMTPGMPVRAEDWNTVVGAVVDIARLFGSGAVTAPPHTHVGQVSSDWLDPSLVDFVETTRQTQQAQAQRLDLLAQRLERVESRIAALGDQVGSLQGLSDHEADAALDRDILLKRIGERVDGHDILGSQLTDLNTRMVRLEPRIDAAVSLRAELTGPEGKLPDFGKLQGQVSDLTQLRDNLRLADGSVGRLRDLERRLDTFEKVGVDDQVLNTRIDAGVKASLAQSGVDAATLTKLVDERVSPVAGGLKELTGMTVALQNSLTQQAELLDNSSSRLQTLETTASVTAELPARVTALESFRAVTSASLVTLQSDVEASLALQDKLGALSSDVDGVRAQLSNFAQTSDVQRLSEQLKDVSVRTGNLEQRISVLPTQDQLTQLGTRLDSTASSLKDVDTGMQVLRTSFADYRKITDTRLNNIDGRVTSLNSASSKVFAELGKLTQRINSMPAPVVVGRGGTG